MNAAYTAYRTKNLMTFYFNPLNNTPNISIDYKSTHALSCGLGLASLYRWTNERHLHRKEFQVPAVAIDYNLNMNGVDSLDQM